MNVLHVNVMNRGEVIVIGTLSCIHRCDVEEVLHLIELAVLEIDVVDEPATIGIRFHVKCTFVVATVSAIFHKDITHAGTHF